MISLNKVIYELVETLTVSKCPSCGRITRRSGTMCPECLDKYRAEKERPCAFCEMPASVCVCSTRNLYYCKYLGRSMYSPLFYEKGNETSYAALRRLKYDSDRGAEKFFARELSREILLLFSETKTFPEDWCITYPPRRKSSRRLYGFDQSRGLAKRIAKYTGMKFETVLSRKGGAAQKKLDAAGRTENALSSYSLATRADVIPKLFV